MVVSAAMLDSDAPPREVGRYALGPELGAGGMAVVHLGRLRGPVGFARTVAIKRLYPTYAKDQSFVAMFVDEARMAARVHHPNVVATLDVVVEDGELSLVMEHIHGLTLAELLRLARASKQRLPPNLAAGIVAGALDGLHAAHEAKNEQGEPLNLVHRDVSPENILVGADGVARVLDFGFARAAGRMQVSTEGVLKGKVAYMAPEQLGSDKTSRQSDVYAAGVVLWEALSGKRLFQAETVGGIVGQMLLGEVDPPSQYNAAIPPDLDAVVLRALSPVPEARFASANAMVLAIEQALPIGTPREISAWMRLVAGEELDSRAALVAEVERGTATQTPAHEDLASQPADAKTDAKSVPKAAVNDVVVSDTIDPTAALSNTTPVQDPRPRRPWLAAAVVVSLLAGVAGLAAGGGSEPSPATTPEMASAPSATDLGGEAPTLDQSAAETPRVHVTPSALPSADLPIAPSEASAKVASLPASAPPPPSTNPAAATTVRPQPQATTTQARAASPAPPKSNCTPPYFIDADGIRVPKPECL